jgi:DNA-binding beta-propeller fold protein YncE
LVVLLGCKPTPSGTRVVIPGGAPGIGFDDLRYSRTLHRVLVPSGRAGVLALIEPESGAVTTIGGFSTSASYEGGHDFGVTAVDEGAGYLFATDRTGAKLHVIDPKAAKIVASVSVAAGPDYVRYVAPTNELWVSEPDGDQIEIFSLSADQPPKLTSSGTIAVKNGPESLVIDAARGRAYTHRWQATTLAIDMKSRSVVGEWKNGCAASRGIDLEPEHGYVLAACNEGTVTVLDAAGDGKILSSLAKGSGYDVIGYNAALRHVYLAGGQCACLTVLGLSGAGQLSFLGREDAPSDTHCATADDVGSAWVCEPKDGSLRKVGDHHPATK